MDCSTSRPSSHLRDAGRAAEHEGAAEGEQHGIEVEGGGQADAHPSGTRALLQPSITLHQHPSDTFHTAPAAHLPRLHASSAALRSAGGVLMMPGSSQNSRSVAWRAGETVQTPMD